MDSVRVYCPTCQARLAAPYSERMTAGVPQLEGVATRAYRADHECRQGRGVIVSVMVTSEIAPAEAERAREEAPQVGDA